MRTFNKQISTDALLNTNSTSPFVPLKNIYMYSMACIITGVPTGSLELQASNDPETNDSVPLTTPPNWITVSGSPQTVTTAGETLWDVSAITYNYVRVLYTDLSGGISTAAMTIIFNGKGV